MKQDHQRNDLYDQVQDAEAFRQRHVHIASPPFSREERRLTCKKPPFLCREEATAITVWYASVSFYHVFCRLSRTICKKGLDKPGKTWYSKDKRSVPDSGRTPLGMELTDTLGKWAVSSFYCMFPTVFVRNGHFLFKIKC